MLRWYWTGGPLRLRAARARRAGRPSDAVVMLFGAAFLIELIRLVPHDLDKRGKITASVLRKACVGRFS